MNWQRSRRSELLHSTKPFGTRSRQYQIGTIMGSGRFVTLLF